VTTVNNDRKPYVVSYTKDGVTHKIHRRPPPKLHGMIVNDTVTIRRRKGEDWDEGEEATIRSISKRQPNTLALEKDGIKTFLPYFDVKFKDRDGESVIADENNNITVNPKGGKYLLWP
jgi:hypothetical protein